MSSKSCNDWALKFTIIWRDIPGAMSPECSLGNFMLVIEKFWVPGGTILTRWNRPELLVRVRGIW